MAELEEIEDYAKAKGKAAPRTTRVKNKVIPLNYSQFTR